VGDYDEVEGWRYACLGTVGGLREGQGWEFFSFFICDSLITGRDEADATNNISIFQTRLGHSEHIALRDSY
jgi:hypothetical protein